MQRAGRNGAGRPVAGACCGMCAKVNGDRQAGSPNRWPRLCASIYSASQDSVATMCSVALMHGAHGQQQAVWTVREQKRVAVRVFSA